MRRKGKRPCGKHFTVNNCSVHFIGSSLQPLTRPNQTQGVIMLLISTGGTLHDVHREGHHGAVESDQLGQ
jgi:hypothetical protein